MRYPFLVRNTASPPAEDVAVSSRPTLFSFTVVLSSAADTPADSDVRHVRPGGADGVDLRVRLRGEQRLGD